MKYRLHPGITRLIVEPVRLEQSALIVVPEADKEKAMVGKIVALGPLAFADYPEEYLNIGDLVAFIKYAGQTDPTTTSNLRCIKDCDVIMKIEEIE